jgi:hypothetical protein
LRSRPIPLVDGAAKWIGARRRYQCTQCGWAGWHHRLRRRSDSVAVQARSAGNARSLAALAIAVGLLLISGSLLSRACAEGRVAQPVDGGSSL